MQCIPEYDGSHSTLEPFIEQVEFFARKLPVGESQKTLVNIIISKLMGYAREHLKKIRASTWDEAWTYSRKTFAYKVRLETLMTRIERLNQYEREPFPNYKERVEQLYDDLEILGVINQPYAVKSLRLHFLAGLKNKNLKHYADT